VKKYLLLVLALVLLLPAASRAQSNRERDSDRRARFERIARVIADCEQRTNEFQRAVRSARERTRYREDDLDRHTTRLERALNKIRESWNREHDVEKTRAYLRDAISVGRDINQTMTHHELRSHVQKEWEAIRSELNNLAEVFGERRIRW
jgi:DNA anti-recombination protein RmuC